MAIEIQIKDDKYYLDVAIVVDREDFQKEISSIRKGFGITAPLINKEMLNQFTIKLVKSRQESKFQKRIELARKNLRLPITYIKVIEAATLKDAIDQQDYKPAFLAYNLGTFDNEGYEVDETYSIVLSPNVRDNDVLKILQEYRDQLDETQGVERYKYISSIWGKEKGKPSIKKYRRWYWSIQSGAKYPQICDKEAEMCPLAKEGITHKTGRAKPTQCTCYDESAIRKGVAAYEQLIWKTPTF